jgi:hypothetical protein
MVEKYSPGVFTDVRGAPLPVCCLCVYSMHVGHIRMRNNLGES